MPKSSEIDALFAQQPAASKDFTLAKKRKAAAEAPTAKPSSKPSSSTTAPTSTSAKGSKPAKRQVTVVQDPSIPTPAAAVTPSSKRKKSAPAPSSAAALPKDLAEFTDSRGTTRRKTDDGLSIYSETELKLGQGGDTPLCPFDCDCCKLFLHSVVR